MTSVLSAKRPVKRAVKHKGKAQTPVVPEAAPPEAKWVLVDEQSRAKLNEGRNYGWGGAFAKRSDRTLTLLDPLTSCRDFLHERVSCEILNKPVSAFGLTSTKADAYDTHAYLVHCILMRGARDSKPYETYDADLKAMRDNLAHTQALVNHVECLLKVNGRTTIETISDNRYVAVLPLFWVRACFLTSLATLIMRVGINWDGVGDPMAFLKSVETVDTGYLRPAIVKLEHMAKEGVPEPDWSYTGSLHNWGIVTWDGAAPKGYIGAPYILDAKAP